VSRLGTRYVVVGFWNTLFGLGNFYLLLWLLGDLHYLVVLTISYSLSILQGHFSQRIFVWRSRGPYFRELIRFSGGAIAQYILNVILLHLAVRTFHLNLRWSQLVVIGVLVALSFLFNKRWVFGSKHEGATPV